MSNYKTTAQKLAEIAAIAESLVQVASKLPTEDIDEYETRLNAVEDSISHMDDTFDNHQSSIDDLSDRIDELRLVDTDDFEDFKDVTEGDLVDHQKTIDALRTQITALEVDRDEHKKRLGTLEMYINSLELTHE